MLFVEKKLNSIIFNEVDFKPEHNYMPELVLAFRDLDRRKAINFVLDLEKAPILFILYFRKLKQLQNSLELNLFFRDESPILPKVLASYGLKYKNISEYPWALPTTNNVKGTKDPFQAIEGYDDPEVIDKIQREYKEHKKHNDVVKVSDSWLPLTAEDNSGELAKS